MIVKLDERIDAVGAISPSGDYNQYGKVKDNYRFASVSKIVTALTIAGVVQDGFISFDDVVPDDHFSNGNVYLKDILSHSSGLVPDDIYANIAPRKKRIYTNVSSEIAAQYTCAALEKDIGRITFSELFNDGLGRLFNGGITMEKSPAYSAQGSFNALGILLREIREPSFIGHELHSYMITPCYKELSGVLPGWGYYKHNTFGIGYEIKGDKHPHWMGPASKRSYGHFGLSGTFIFHDPVHEISICCVTNTEFGPWAKKVYPQLCNDIYESFS